ncbi:hypothetical protein Btru_071305 [Bulinus truncatus]|nr:hypothetical protein Btru_071305 [Bulinus truncatus]
MSPGLIEIPLSLFGFLIKGQGQSSRNRYFLNFSNCGPDLSESVSTSAGHKSQSLNNNVTLTTKVVDKLHIVHPPVKHPTPVTRYAALWDLMGYEWPISQIPNNSYDVGVLASFGHLIPKRIIDAFPYGIINVHPSLLPRWRGAALYIIQYSIRDVKSGISIMSLKPKHFDSGPILKQKVLDIPFNYSLSGLRDFMSLEGGKQIIEVLSSLPEFIIAEQKQSENDVTYAHKLKLTMSFIDWENQTLESIDRQYRALHETTELRSEFNGVTIRLLDMLNPRYTPNLSLDSSSPPGLPVFDRGLIYCGQRGWGLRSTMGLGRVSHGGHGEVTCWLGVSHAALGCHMRPWGVTCGLGVSHAALGCHTCGLGVSHAGLGVSHAGLGRVIAANFLECSSKLPCENQLKTTVDSMRKNFETSETQQHCPTVGSCSERIENCNSVSTQLGQVNKNTQKDQFCKIVNGAVSCFDFVRKDPICINEQMVVSDFETMLAVEMAPACGASIGTCIDRIKVCSMNQKIVSAVDNTTQKDEFCKRVVTGVSCFDGIRSDINCKIDKPELTSWESQLRNIITPYCKNAGEPIKFLPYMLLAPLCIFISRWLQL